MNLHPMLLHDILFDILISWFLFLILLVHIRTTRNFHLNLEVSLTFIGDTFFS